MPSSPPSSTARFIKTHTPLDGIPLDPRCTYIVDHPASHSTWRSPSTTRVEISIARRLRPGTPRPRPTPEVHSADTPTPPARMAPGLDRPGRRSAGAARLAARRAVALHRCLATASAAQHRARALRRPLCRPRRRMRRLAGRLGIPVPESGLAGPDQAASFDVHAGRCRSDRPRSVGDPEGPAAFFRRGTLRSRRRGAERRRARALP